jgi:hypothetical protein
MTNLWEILAEAGTVYSGTDVDNDSDYLPTIEEPLLTMLQKEGFVADDPSPDHSPRS